MKYLVNPNTGQLHADDCRMKRNYWQRWDPTRAYLTPGLTAHEGCLPKDWGSQLENVARAARALARKPSVSAVVCEKNYREMSEDPNLPVDERAAWKILADEMLSRVKSDPAEGMEPLF